MSCKRKTKENTVLPIPQYTKNHPNPHNSLTNQKTTTPHKKKHHTTNTSTSHPYCYPNPKHFSNKSQKKYINKIK